MAWEAAQHEIENLTRALAAGGDLPSLIAALQQAEQRRRALEVAIDAARREQLFTAADARALQSKVLAKVDEWRTAMRQEAREARAVLRQLLVERVTLERAEHDGRRCYRYRGKFTTGGIFEGLLRPQMVTSPTGFEPVFWP